ncbi:uncharacterized protein LOC116950693 [Petromyzon marinus]|uniref:uncharacterized protein LOC116950693 n=1 Tax=Petromyzon marinus TaxID=7757 RepID=UPI003F72B7EC
MASGRRRQKHSSSTSSSSLSPPSSPAISMRDMGRPRGGERTEVAGARTHAVVRGDTLAGLALRYGVTTEQIRRANHLFANESLFLRTTLLIPVPGPPDSPDNGNSSSGRTAEPRPLANGGEGTATTASTASAASAAGSNGTEGPISAAATAGTIVTAGTGGGGGSGSGSNGRVEAAREDGRLDAAPNDEVTASDFFSRIDARLERTRANLGHGGGHGSPAVAAKRGATATPSGGQARASPGSARGGCGATSGGDSTGLLEVDDELIFSDDHFGRLDFHSQQQQQQQQRAQHEPTA